MSQHVLSFSLEEIVKFAKMSEEDLNVEIVNRLIKMRHLQEKVQNLEEFSEVKTLKEEIDALVEISLNVVYGSGICP